ncbi:UNVERIFIED_CONTAM: hypothetical protein GTU68_003017 [Idotea baltica]|nr:hypothetical protein [Idotea baltica]
MAATNSKLTLRGNPVKVRGEALSLGQPIPLVSVTNAELKDISLEELLGSELVILAIPSLDTPVCQIEVRQFNMKISETHPDTKVVVVSRDLPFAQSRWCAAEGIDNVVVVSDYKHRVFGEAFGVELPDVGILCRAVFVADKEGKLKYLDYVDEISDEPNYDAVLASLS